MQKNCKVYIKTHSKYDYKFKHVFLKCQNAYCQGADLRGFQGPMTPLGIWLGTLWHPQEFLYGPIQCPQYFFFETRGCTVYTIELRNVSSKFPTMKSKLSFYIHFLHQEEINDDKKNTFSSVKMFNLNFEKQVILPELNV